MAHIIRCGACIVAALAWGVARRRPYHAPMAWWLGANAVADAVRWWLAATVLTAMGPYHGTMRVAFHVEQALLLVEPVGLAAVAMESLWRGGSVVAAVAGTAAWAALVAAYPRLRGATLGAAYAAVEMAGVVAVAIVSVAWWRQRRWPTLTDVLLCAHAAMLAAMVIAGPWASTAGPFVAWASGDGTQVTVLLFSATAHAVWLRAIS